MKTMILMLAGAALIVPVLPASAMPLATGASNAHIVVSDSADHNRRQRHNHRDEQARGETWQGRDGRTYCRRSDGTTGLLVGAVGGALVGRTIDTRGDRTAGTVIGGVAGALAGREIERSTSRCR